MQSYWRDAESVALAWLAVASNPLSDYWRRNTDADLNPFRGLYQLNSFDLAIMLPYFFVMVDAGAVRHPPLRAGLQLLRTARNVAGPPPEITAWPKVTVQLPIYNERYVIERLVEAVAQFDYPRELLQIQVLDDSTDETQEVARDCVERYRRWACRSTTFIATIAKDSKRARCRKA